MTGGAFIAGHILPFAASDFYTTFTANGITGITGNGITRRSCARSAITIGDRMQFAASFAGRIVRIAFGNKKCAGITRCALIGISAGTGLASGVARITGSARSPITVRTGGLR